MNRASTDSPAPSTVTGSYKTAATDASWLRLMRITGHWTDPVVNENTGHPRDLPATPAQVSDVMPPAPRDALVERWLAEIPPAAPLERPPIASDRHQT